MKSPNPTTAPNSQFKFHRMLALVVLVLATSCDAIRDAWIARNIGWWHWHIIKWIAFYSPLVMILYLVRFNRRQVVLLSVGGLLLWTLMHRLAQWLLHTHPLILGVP